jgi:Spy/CpxP family protein refolding chaperone
MTPLLRSLLLTGLLATAAAPAAQAQAPQPAESKEAAYTRTITERADKIVAKLEGLKPAKTTKVREVIVAQYRALNDIHEARKTRLAALKAQAPGPDTEPAKQKIEAETTAALDQLHPRFLGQLGRHLTPGQIEQVKDGMTYGVLPITVKAYSDMLPDLTAEQKAQILAWLTEAREKAMDAGTSEQKHAWFGKYKGKINNYLSAAGIDMKQAGKDWEARRQRAAAEAQN